MLVRIQLHSYRLNWNRTVKLVDSFNFKIRNFLVQWELKNLMPHSELAVSFHVPVKSHLIKV